MSLEGKNFKLASGNLIPAIGYGFGTKWYKGGTESPIDEASVKALARAIEYGYTHLDGAEVYGNYPEFKLGIKGFDRSKLYITDKFNSSSQEAGHTPYKAAKSNLSKLGLDYFDLFLIHSPFITKETHGFDLVEAWEDLVKLKDEGLVKDIGVSNFRVEDLKKILDSNPKYKPVVNQIEFSAYLQNQTPGIVQFSKDNDILIEAYGSLSPIRNTPGPLDDYLEQLSKKYNKSTGQILLRWSLEQDILPITTTSNEKRYVEFLDVFDFKLTPQEVKEIIDLGSKKTLRKFWNQQFGKYD